MSKLAEVGIHVSDRQIVYLAHRAHWDWISHLRTLIVGAYHALLAALTAAMIGSASGPTAPFAKWIIPLVLIVTALGCAYFDGKLFTDWRYKHPQGVQFEVTADFMGPFTSTDASPYPIVKTMYRVVYIFWMLLWALILYLLQIYDIEHLGRVPQLFRDYIAALFF